MELDILKNSSLLVVRYRVSCRLRHFFSDIGFVKTPNKIDEKIFKLASQHF